MPQVCIAVKVELVRVDQTPHVKSPMCRVQIQVELHTLRAALDCWDVSVVSKSHACLAYLQTLRLNTTQKNHACSTRMVGKGHLLDWVHHSSIS